MTSVITVRIRGSGGLIEEETLKLESGEITTIPRDREIIELEMGGTTPKFWSKRPTDPADLWERYHERGQSQPEIADDLGVSPATVSRWMERAGINIEQRSQ